MAKDMVKMKFVIYREQEGRKRISVVPWPDLKCLNAKELHSFLANKRRVGNITVEVKPGEMFDWNMLGCIIGDTIEGQNVSGKACSECVGPEEAADKFVKRVKERERPH